VIIGLNIFALVVLVGLLANASSYIDEQCAGETLERLCRAVQERSYENGVVVVVVLWAAMDVILGVLFLVTRRRADA
jgi:hypothetical protein